MKKKILKELDFDENYDTNSVIQANSIVYSHYVGCNIEVHNRQGNSLMERYISGKDNKNESLDDITYYKSSKPRVIIGYEPIIEKGYFLYNHSDLLDKICEYGEKIYNVLNKEEIKQYIFKLDDKFNLDSAYYPIKNVKTPKMSIVFEFFNEFGFPFSITSNATNIFPCNLIENKLIPSLLTIYTVYSMYKSIDYINSICTSDETDFTTYKLLNNEFNKIYFMECIFNDKLEEKYKVQSKLTIDENNIDNISYYLIDYKDTFINIINTIKNNFRPPKLLYTDDGQEDSHIPISNNIFELAWYFFYNQISTNIRIKKIAVCRKCHKSFEKKTDDVYCKNCKTQVIKKDEQEITKNNKKQFILRLLNKYKNYIFCDKSINQKLIDLKLLQVNNKLDNIDNHKWRIRKDLEPLEKQIEIEILNNRYKMKVDN